MHRKPEISATYARLVLQSGRVDAAALLNGVALTAKELFAREFVDASDLAVLFRNYDQLVGDPTWTAQLGAQLNVASHGPLGFAALSAPTLGEALDVMGEFHACRNTALTSRTSASATHYQLSLFDTTGDPELLQWLAEVILKIVELLLASILGHPVGRNVTITLTRATPDYAEQLVACYDSTVHFDAPVNAIIVPLAWRQLPSPLHDEAVYRVNLIKCRELIAAREQADSVAHAVRNRLTNHFEAQVLAREGTLVPPPTLQDVAQAMHLTPRTLLRRLQRENVTYREILDALRRDYAAQLLRDASLTVANVGEIIGYREPANFGRAFRRWYGLPPAAWRRQREE